MIIRESDYLLNNKRVSISNRRNISHTYHKNGYYFTCADVADAIYWFRIERKKLIILLERREISINNFLTEEVELYKKYFSDAIKYKEKMEQNDKGFC